jgi:peptidyl-prolyl cis-trans isomerase C
MLKRLTFLSAMAVAAALALPTHADEVTADTVVTSINGTDITVGHLIIARNSLPAQYQQISDDVLFGLLVDQLERQAVLAQSLEGDLPRHIALSLENEQRIQMASEVIDGIAAAPITDAALQALYDERYADGFGGDEFNAAHILVETEEEAQAIKVELDGGADFAEMAKAKSTGPSGPNGGDLGWFGPGMMVPPFEEAVVAMEPGQISAPVQTQFGWHLIILNEKRKTEAPKLDDVRTELSEELSNRAINERVDALMNAATIERAEVDFDPTVLQNLDLLKD